MIAAVAFVLASSTFAPNRTMPKTTVYTGCGGPNRSPELHWKGKPKGTKSFALIVHDPDAPHPGGWYHWVVYNIPTSTVRLAENAPIDPARLGMTSFGSAGYGGPCPPPGKPHHYNFSLYALDTQIRGDRLDAIALQKAMRGHILARAQLTGIYER